MILPRLLYRLSARLPVRLITRYGAPYLERYHLGRLGPCTAYLHRFVAGDGDPEPHDHPWDAWSLVLTGHYVERRCELSGREGLRGRLRRVAWLNRIRGGDIHQIADARPETWTLFIHTRVRKGWGFFQAVDQDPRGAVLYSQPLDPVGPDWHTTAPRGAQSRRAPFRGQA